MTNREVEVGRFFRKRFFPQPERKNNGSQAVSKFSLFFFGGDKISHNDFDCFQIQFRQLR